MPISLTSAKKLREERNDVYVKIRQLADKAHDEKRAFTPEEDASWKELNADFNSRTRQIEIEERAIELEREQNSPADRDPPGRDDRSRRSGAGEGPRRRKASEKRKQASEEDRTLAVQAWCRKQMDLPISRRQAEAAERCGIRPSAKALDLRLDRNYRQVRSDWQREQRAMSASDMTVGGTTIPAQTLVGNFETALLDFSGVRQVAEVIRTDSGESMSWPTANDTGNEGELIGENTTVANLDPSFGNVKWSSYKVSSKLIKVPYEWLEDTMINGPAELGRMLGERIGRRQNRALTTGVGGSTVNGIVTASTMGKTTAGATAVTFDEIIALIHSVDPAYRNSAGTGFMFHDNILMEIRKLKDTTNQYLWQPSNQVGVPDRLLSYRYWINQSMQSSLATATKTMLFGDLSKYKIRDVGTVRLRRLVERFADSDQEGFVAFARFDGNLLDAGTHPVKHMLQA